MANSVIRGTANIVQGLPNLQYSIIINGTQDVSGVEQKAICIHHVDHNLVPHEYFIGYRSI